LYSHDSGIFKIDVKSGQRTKIADSGSEPFFTASSERVYFTGNDKKGEVFTGQLYSTDLSGNDKQNHYQGEWISHFKVSPDEKWLAFIQNYQVYVTPFVRNGQYIATGSGAKNLPLKKFSTYAGKNLTWSKDAKELSWAMGPNLYQQPLSAVFDFLNDEKADDKPEAQQTTIELTAQTDKPSGLVALKGAQIITMEQVDGEQQVIENGVIVIKDNRIQSVGTDISIPKDAEVIDVSGKTITRVWWMSTGTVLMPMIKSYLRKTGMPMRPWLLASPPPIIRRPIPRPFFLPQKCSKPV
jgi:Imidazolonepropionase and related amidohydrolases